MNETHEWRTDPGAGSSAPICLEWVRRFTIIFASVNIATPFISTPILENLMPTPYLMSEGQHVDHFGNLIWPIYVDFRDPSDRKPITTLIKGCRDDHAIETSGQILISKPSRFRCFGENLIRDPGEARASHTEVTLETFDDPRDLARARLRDQAMNRAAELTRSTLRTNTTGVRTTRSNTQALTFGKNGWIFCASIEPTTDDEWEQWHSTLEAGYNHVSHIHRPREFARALATMVAEQLGAHGKPAVLPHSFEEEPTLRTRHGVQWLFHGPVIYVDDVYGLINAATTKHELMLLPLFAKESTHQAQREYRFVIWAESEPSAKTTLLNATPAMVGAMTDRYSRQGLQVMPPITLPENGLVSASEDRASDDVLREDSDGEHVENSPRVIDRVNHETEGFRAWRTRSGGPSRVVRAANPDPDDLSAMTGTYSSIRALRIKVDEFRTSADQSPDEKLRASAAAWYAEQDIRALCQEFDYLACGISISSDCFIVVHVSIAEWPEIDCTLAVAPTGESVLRLAAQSRQITRKRERRAEFNDTGQQVKEFITELTRESSVPASGVRVEG